MAGNNSATETRNNYVIQAEHDYEIAMRDLHKTIKNLELYMMDARDDCDTLKAMTDKE